MLLKLEFQCLFWVCSSLYSILSVKSHSFPLNAPIGTLQPHPFDVFDSSACLLTKQPPLPEWIESLHCSAVPSTLVLTLYVHHV